MCWRKIAKTPNSPQNRPNQGFASPMSHRERRESALDMPITPFLKFKKGNMPSMSSVIFLGIAAFIGLSGAGILTESESTTEQAPEFVHSRIPSELISSSGANTCADCHTFDPLFSHPVEITPPPSMNVPASLPLINGRVTCITCHANTGGNHLTGRLAEDERLSFFNTGRGLCLQCHGSNGFSAQDIHAQSTHLAHLPQSSHSQNARIQSTGAIPEWLDAESDSCMTCHDGAMASGSGTNTGMNRRNSLFDTSGSEHPIGMYRLTNPSDSDGPLKPASMLDHRIRLFNNQVGCGSCHSVYSTQRDLLVMSNDGSQLCLGCHEY